MLEEITACFSVPGITALEMAEGKPPYGDIHPMRVSFRILYPSVRPPDKSAYWKNIFFISHAKHMLWVLKRTVSMRRFF